jgi:RNA polymerase sigma-70 factor (ECF subfamily)
LPDAAAALEQAARDEGGRVLATLIRQLGGDFTLAEDALQDAYTAAIESWPRTGVPDNPGAWLTTASRRKAIDRLRRARALDDRIRVLEALADDVELQTGDEMPTSLTDDRLRLIFTCCHPALSLEARVALTLKCLGGLTTAEVAAAFLVPEATMGQRLLRAKKKIERAGIPYRVPADEELPDRLGGVLQVLYLVFTEGHTASSGNDLIRVDLVSEAIRLTRLLRRLMPDEPEVAGLLALMLLHDSRRAARVDADGRTVTLDLQDRRLWDATQISEGIALVQAALRRRAPGTFQIQASIAALHAEAATAEDTDWPQIAALYGTLAATSPSPVVEVNRAVAVGFADGPAAGLEILDRLDAEAGGLARYTPFHAARADLLRRSGDRAGADAAHALAVEFAENAAQRAALRERREAHIEAS